MLSIQPTARTMPRKRRSYNIDERVIDALTMLAQKDNMSANRYLENLLFSLGKQQGFIPMDAQPLGETRGGYFGKNSEEGAANA